MNNIVTRMMEAQSMDIVKDYDIFCKQHMSISNAGRATKPFNEIENAKKNDKYRRGPIDDYINNTKRINRMNYAKMNQEMSTFFNSLSNTFNDASNEDVFENDGSVNFGS